MISKRPDNTLLCIQLDKLYTSFSKLRDRETLKFPHQVHLLLGNSHKFEASYILMWKPYTHIQLIILKGLRTHLNAYQLDKPSTSFKPS